MESDELVGYDYWLEWMALAYASWYPRSSTVLTAPPTVEVVSSRSSSEFAVVPDIDRPGPSCAARVVVSSGSSSVGDPASLVSHSSQLS